MAIVLMSKIIYACEILYVLSIKTYGSKKEKNGKQNIKPGRERLFLILKIYLVGNNCFNILYNQTNLKYSDKNNNI